MNIFQTAKLLINVRNAVNTIEEGKMKSGYLSSEFLAMTVIPVLFHLWNQFHAMIPPATSLEIVAVLVALYGLFRSIVKILNMLLPYMKNQKEVAIVNGLTKVESAIDSQSTTPITAVAKALVLAVAVFSFIGIGKSYADAVPVTPVAVVNTLQSIPQAKQGAMYVPVSQQIDYISTWQIVTKSNFSLEAGYLAAGGLCAVVSYDIGGLKDLGVTVPILTLIDLNVGFATGMQFIGSQNKGIAGPSITLIQTKF